MEIVLGLISSLTLKQAHMKKNQNLWLLLLAFLLSASVMAQSEAFIKGVKPEQFKPVVFKVLRDNGYEIFSDNSDIETRWKEYTVNMVLKYRAMISFKFQDDGIKISILQKQALLNNGSWGDAAIPSKKADDKLIATLVEAIQKILNDPSALASVIASSPKPIPASSPEKEKTDPVALNNVIQGASTGAQAKVPSIINAKEMQFHPDDDYEFHEGFCAIKKHDLWGFIDTKGNVTVEFQYFPAEGIFAPYYSNGIAMVADRKDGMNIPVYLDAKGQQLFKNIKMLWGTPFQGGIALFGKGTTVYSATYSFYNKAGQPLPGSVINPSSTGLKNYPFHEGLAPFQDSKTSTWGFINQQGKWAIQPGKFNAVGEFSEGLAAVQNKTNYYWGFINTKGEVVIPFDYKNKPDPFSDGLAAVKNSEDNIGYIDKTGKLAVPYTFNGYTTAGPFRNGFAAANMNGKGYMIIDKTGNMVRKLNGTQIKVFKNGWIGWFNDLGDHYTQTWGIVTPDGKDVLVPGFFRYIGQFSDGMAWASASINGKLVSGFINENFDFEIIQKTE
jgi:hypothetical protein